MGLGPIGGMAEGLNKSIQQYLNTSIEVTGKRQEAASNQQDAMNLKQYESTLDTQKQAKLQEAELNKNTATEKYKNSLEDQLTPEMAEKALPGYGGKMVNDYNASHPDNPLKLKGGLDYLKMATDALNPDTSATSKHQDKLEKDYADRRSKVLSNKSGGLGLQDAKVNQAIDLRTAISQFYDPTTDKYNIPPSMHEELALGVAKLMSPSGTVAQELVDKLKQGTAREKLANAAIYLGIADPRSIGGPTQDVAKLFVDTIDRQGQMAEHLRNHYEEGLKDLVPTGLDSKRKEHVDKADITNSFTKALNQAPDYQKRHQETLKAHPAGKIQVLSPDGKTKGFIPAGQLEEATKAGYKQL